MKPWSCWTEARWNESKTILSPTIHSWVPWILIIFLTEESQKPNHVNVLKLFLFFLNGWKCWMFCVGFTKGSSLVVQSCFLCGNWRVRKNGSDGLPINSLYLWININYHNYILLKLLINHRLSSSWKRTSYLLRTHLDPAQPWPTLRAEFRDTQIPLYVFWVLDHIGHRTFWVLNTVFNLMSDNFYHIGHWLLTCLW